MHPFFSIMFVNIDLTLSCVVNLDDLICWNFVKGDIDKNISDEDKLKALNGTSEKYVLYNVKDLLSASDIGDYEIIDVEVEKEK